MACGEQEGVWWCHGDNVAVSAEEANLNLCPGSGHWESLPVHDFRHNLEAMKKSVVGGMGGCCLCWMVITAQGNSWIFLYVF